MAKVLLVACLLALAQHIAGQCNTPVQYSQTLVPQCAANDIYVDWPNYENFATYYTCNGVGNPVLNNCPSGEYFCFVLQECVGCDNWIPPVQCSQLKTQNTPNCVPMGQGQGPTAAPTSAPSTAPPPITTPTPAPTQAPTEAPTTLVPVPDPTNPSATDVPPPPSPVPTDPNVPMPPTPGPTPPSVEVTPPNEPSVPIL